MLSILIVNWNTRDLLVSCLKSIYLHPPSGAFEVIVVDNASSDGSAEAVELTFPNVVLVKSQQNLGYAAGNNLAFERSTGEWILTLNADTEVYDSSLDVGIERISLNQDTGALGAMQIGLDGQVQRSVRGFPSVPGILGMLTRLDNLFPLSALGSYSLPNFDYTKEQLAPQPMGTFLLFRRSALEAVVEFGEPFDARFPIFFNEVDLLYRLKLQGWNCIYSPAVKILHHGGESTKLVKKNMIWESHNSLIRYMKKRNQRGVWLIAPIVKFAAFIRARGFSDGFRT